jgi:hypothetical protein
MRIEFASIGNGANVEILLLDDFGVRDRVYSADHTGCFQYGETPINARQLFQFIEETWAKPIIGGRYGHLHPYWNEREEKRKARESNV